MAVFLRREGAARAPLSGLGPEIEEFVENEIQFRYHSPEVMKTNFNFNFNLDLDFDLDFDLGRPRAEWDRKLL